MVLVEKVFFIWKRQNKNREKRYSLRVACSSDRGSGTHIQWLIQRRNKVCPKIKSSRSINF